MSEEIEASSDAIEESSAPAVEPEVPAPGAEGEHATESAAEAAPEPTLEERLEAWGGSDKVEQAMRLYRDLTTDGEEAEAARTQMLLTLANYYGISQRELMAMLPNADELPAEEAPAEDDDEDRPLTRKEFLEMQRQQQAESAAAAARAQGQSAFDAVVSELGLGQQQKEIVAMLGNKYLEPEGAFPTADEITKAMKKGYADYQKQVEAEAQKYLEEKRKTADELPTPLSGGTTSAGSELPPPKNVKEASARVRAQILGQ